MRSFVAACVVMFFLVSQSVFAQDAPSKGWIDVNVVSLRSFQGEQAYSIAWEEFTETATAATAYPKLPSAVGAGVEGGFRFHPRFGLGVHFTFVNYESTAGLAVSLPHPYWNNDFATDVDATDSTLKRRDRAFDINAMYFVPTPDRWSVRIFGGPTYFKVSQEMVESFYADIAFNRFTGYHVVDITSFTKKAVDGSAWGFNAGADVGYFFTRHVGIGGVIRMNRGAVGIVEPFTEDTAELAVGHVTLGAGLRLRF